MCGVTSDPMYVTVTLILSHSKEGLSPKQPQENIIPEPGHLKKQFTQKYKVCNLLLKP